MANKQLKSAAYPFEETQDRLPMRVGMMHIETEPTLQESAMDVLGETPTRPRMPMNAEAYNEMCFCFKQAETKEDVLDVIQYYLELTKSAGDSYMAAALAALAAKIESGETAYDFVRAIKRAVSA